MKYEIYSGAGNDFVMLKNTIPAEKQGMFTEKICNELFRDIDGVIFAERAGTDKADIRMNYYNRDGSYGAMCGNGARCIAKYASDKSIIKGSSFNIEAVDKIYMAEIKNDSVKIGFPAPQKIETDKYIQLDDFELLVHYVNVGSDHAVIFIDEEKNKAAFRNLSIVDLPINELGRKIRFLEAFKPRGVNVNFALKLNNKIQLRTYERGVERETLACGTGIVSTGIIAVIKQIISPPVSIISQSGESLTVDLKYDNNQISDLTLEGSARKIDEGEFDENKYLRNN